MDLLTRNLELGKKAPEKIAFDMTKAFDLGKKKTQLALDRGYKALDHGWKVWEVMKGKSTSWAAGIGGGVVILTAGVKGTVGLIYLIGFQAGGVGAGTIAAAWQSYLGNVAPGSLFSTLQSLGATGVWTGSAVGVICSVGLAAGTGLIVYKILNRMKNDPVRVIVGCNCGIQDCSKMIVEMVKMDDSVLLKSKL